MLTPRELGIVQGDWAKIELVAESAATVFYDRLFLIEPNVEHLFQSNFAEQKIKLIRMIGAAVHGLRDPDVLIPIVRKLGRKHFELGVRNEHYAKVGAALLWTLKQALGEAFTVEHEVTWTKVYGILAEEMKASA